jgi:hypothetical protein
LYLRKLYLILAGKAHIEGMGKVERKLEPLNLIDMKKIITILIWLTSLNLIAQYPTATLKIGTIYNPQPDTVLVPVTCEAFDNPINGNNLVSAFRWYFAYDTQVLYAGAPGTPVTFINLHPGFPMSEYVSNIIADYPAVGWNTLAIVYSTGASGSVYPGDKFFDIQFTYSEGSAEEPNIIWTTSPQGFSNNMADDEGNEFLLNLIDGYAGPASNDVTFHVTSNGNDLEGAWVTVGLVTLPTNAEGIAVFNLPDGDYDYTVTKEGFADEEGTFTVAGSPQLIEVEMEECWDVIFQIGGCDSAAFYYNGEYLMIYPNDPMLVCLPNGYYLITVYNNGYFEQGAFEVYNSSTTIEFDCPPLFYSVTFFVNCCGEPLENIPITYEGQTVMTNVAGLAMLNMPAGFYSFEIEGVPITFTVPDTVFVPVDICSEITFHLTSQGNPVAGASVTVDDETIWTNADGEAVFCLQNGIHTYIITHPDYETQTGSFNVNGEPYTIEIWWPEILSDIIFNLSALPCNNSFDDFIIVINGDTISFGEYISLFSGSYSFSIFLDECSMPIESGNIYVNDAPLTIEVVLPVIPNVNFHVTDQWLSDFEGAVINIEGDILITDNYGIASFCMTGGYHDYWVANPGYDTVPGNFVFPCQDTTIEFMLMTGSIEEDKLTLFELYPNPSSGKFYFETKNTGSNPIELQVMDLTGRIVYQRQPTISEKFEIDLSGQPKGMYFVRVKSGEGLFTEKIVVQ